jgi:hypothetical protein
MDEKGFSDSLRKDRKSEQAIQAHLGGIRAFEAYLGGLGKTLESAEPQDLRGFAEKADADVFGIGYYYEFCGNEAMWATASDLWSAPNYEKFKLKEFLDVDLPAVEIFKRRGIVTCPQMVAAGRTPEMRRNLAQQTGISEETVLELIKLADQARISGHKRVRARLFHNAGLDTLDKIAALEPEQVRQALVEYIERTGFPGIPSTPKEAAHSVTLARYLPRLVEY